jgi:putative glycosyltransferase (TIGR04372 family)
VTVPSPQTDPSVLTANAMVEAARTHRKAKRLRAALALLETAIRLWPQNARVRHQFGLALLVNGDAEGVVHLLQAVRQDPADVDRIADLAEALGTFAENETAQTWFRRSLAQAPTRADLAVRFGLFLARLKAYGAAEGWIRRGLGLKHPFGHGYVVLGSVLQLAGRRGEAIAAFYRATQTDPDHAEAYVALTSGLYEAGAPLAQVVRPGRIAAQRLPDRQDLVMPLVQCLRDIGEEAESVRLASRIIDREMDAAAQDEVGACGFRILVPDDMILRIGEIAMQLDLHVKMKMLGWLPPFVSILLAPKEKVVNHAILDHFRRYVTVIDDPKLISLLEPLKRRIPFNPVYVRLPDGRAFSKNRAYFAVQAEWQRQGRAPLLELSQKEVEHGRKELGRIGMPDGAWFVCLHVREPGYMREGANSSEAARNADVYAYLPAIAEITRRGGWVIRIGDPSMKPLPPLPQVVDYAVSPFKSAEMDIFLTAGCRFLLGTTSGLVLLSESFGVPVGSADFFPIGEMLHTSETVIIPKPCREKVSGRMLFFEEYLKMPLALTYDSVHFASSGLEALNSEAEDIRDLAVEMLERTQGEWPYDAEDERLNQRWHELCRPFAMGDVGSRIGRGFLRRHRHLFQSV